MNVSLYQEAPRLKPLALAVMLAMSQVTMEVAQAETVVQVKESLDDCSTSDTAEVNDGKECTDKDVTDKDVTSDEALSVIGSETTVIQGRELATEDVFLRDISNVHATRENIENYKGTSVGDLFKGLSGVYTGEARNSGALDPNIRGVQGTGRVPVLIDGTEQSTTIWLGPGGVSNRSYVDPNLVGGITAEKGPSFEGSSGIGGAVRIRTLEPGDIIQPGKTWGIELKTETSTNTTTAREGATAWNGKDYRTLAGDAVGTGTGGDFGYLQVKPGTGITMPSRDDATGFNGDDHAWRMALAAEREHFDFIAVQSYRRSGNYFSGSNGADSYQRENWLEMAAHSASQNAQDSNDFRNYLAHLFPPGNEVMNTHNEMTSTLLKGRLDLPHDQTLRLSWMHTDQVYGESNHSHLRYIANNPDHYGIVDGSAAYAFVAPSSEVDQDAYNLEYAWNPDNSLIDFKMRLWGTESTSVRHQNGGSNLQPMETDRAYNSYVQCEIWPKIWPENSMYSFMCNQSYYYDPDTNPYAQNPDYLDTSIDGTLINASRQEWNNNRYGFRFSNTFDLGPALSMTLSGDAQHETVDGWDAREAHLSWNPLVIGNGHMGPRNGTRREYNSGLYMEWFPADTLMVTGGLKYSRYWSYDDGLAEHRRNQHRGWERRRTMTHRAVAWAKYIDDDALARINAYQQAKSNGTLTADDIAQANSLLQDVTGGYVNADAGTDNQLFYGKSLNTVTVGGANYLVPENRHSYDEMTQLLNAYIETPDNNVDGWRAKNPFTNGTLDIHEKVTMADGTVVPRYLKPGEYEASTGDPYVPGTSDPAESMVWIQGAQGTANARPVLHQHSEDSFWPTPKKRRNEAWAPMLGLTWFMTPHNRVYARYSEYVRFPSLWEDTQSSTSYGLGIDTTGYTLEPERTRNIEIGYVQDLTPWLRNTRVADIRLNYYKNRIENFIDRDLRFQVMQFDEKRTEGVELQARLDTGRYFAGLGATYRLNNELCDADYAASLDPYFASKYPACVTAGFPQTFTRNSLQPDLSVNLDGGARFLGERLELGGRVTYHSSATNEDEEAWIANNIRHSLNEAYSWEPILVYDAYATYEINNLLKVNAGVNNITDEYYLDPLARTTLPAPGRTFKLGLTAKF